MDSTPTTQKVIVLEKVIPSNSLGPIWHHSVLREIPLRTRAEGELTIKISSFSFNHRDVWIRKGLYPSILFPSIIGSDCTGTVVGPVGHSLQGVQVVVYPAVNWLEDSRGPDVPEKPFGILGGTRLTDGVGTFAEYIQVPESSCVPVPSHLSGVHAAAIPLAGLTAFRAVFTKAEVKSGMRVLVTGIGGGVAIFALQLCLAVGAKVWVTSGSEEKLKAAKALGAEGGVNYKQDDWSARLASLLPADRLMLDVVIDSSGGEIIQKCKHILRDGGRLVCYGSTTGAPMKITMAEVLKNLELRTSTMGSLLEFKQMVEFIGKHQIRPVVFKTLSGFEAVEEGFEIINKGEQFGKVVVVISHERPTSPRL
ncbi:hypothetical protein CROQUDRAFT_37612 [Cronartium quercuum f. sp. fusiforme G11]|uniref:Enoyl reductase (ER) domain-containing protein n=1 Tax=Cronartium quercuum f. sp. fusiforme G11 TaxID=708437 RepID=A0A9P6NPE8_9BASI|nr:hypothetical protein CROQUDRAFT_37612 [Cronartium quercuum f. sp. fusiforme G11]